MKSYLGSVLMVCLNLYLRTIFMFKELVLSEFFSGTHKVIFGKCADRMSESRS